MLSGRILPQSFDMSRKAGRADPAAQRDVRQRGARHWRKNANEAPIEPLKKYSTDV
ncbi:hypothetical protein AWB75_02550 [Caballeronia catudaia]|uniref:Uncharacterized protein n=1 Tax=Caballeronia catudaia TaxID=1777136 RepID=A0A158ASF4_9BURK|nr:hypothetical protein [Caballeronia catudaia]SAK60673.1 hypothetical protein AWB75_02550 [Caballeronia catudaia]